MTQNRVNTTAVLRQFLHTSTNSVITSDAQILLDTSIPQITEGEQVLSLAITPISASSTLEITCDVNVYIENPPWATMALFQDSTADALRATLLDSLQNSGFFRHVMTSGTTSATTFTVRIGGIGPMFSRNVQINARNNAVRILGGVQIINLVIKEYL